MNFKNKLKNRKIARDSIMLNYRHKNVLSWHATESSNHVQMKLEICKYLKSKGIEFYTEAIFNNLSGRCDILNADDLIVYEVFETEKENSLIRKGKEYPFPVITVNAKQEFKEELIL